MDKKPNKREKTNIESQSSLNEFYGAMLRFLGSSHQSTLKAMDDRLKSRWLWGNARLSLLLDKALANITYVLAKQQIHTSFVIDIIQKRVTNLEKIVEEIADKTKADLSSIQKEMAELKEGPFTETVRKYIDEFRKDFEEYKATRDKYFSMLR